jgi:phosphoglucomutase
LIFIILNILSQSEHIGALKVQYNENRGFDREVRGGYMGAHDEYEKWLTYTGHSEDLVQDLLAIRNNEQEVEERFGRELEFGTGGMRGVIGSGLNRMNIHTVRRVSHALAHYVLRQGGTAAENGIVIGYDCRRKSSDFAVAAGLVMAAAGVRAYVFPYLCPTPELSFTVRNLHAAAGVMITASHNPPQYNGYKVYGQDGGQLLPDAANDVRGLMVDSAGLFEIPTLPLDKAQETGLFAWVDTAIRDTYVSRVASELSFPSVTGEARNGLRIVYTPLHGTGNVPVQKVLRQVGYENVFYVASQTDPDGEFPTVKSPNPEEPEALTLGIQLAKQVGADIVLGTDPDADRVGIAVRDVRDGQGEYKLFTGNQVGALLTDFVLRERKRQNQIPENGVVYKTIVTSELGREVAESYGVRTFDTLTGFKYIGEQITKAEQTGESTFLFGYEESYGYLLSPIVRDKDAVQTALAIAEMAASEKSAGRTLIDSLEELYRKFGWHRETLLSKTLPGADGMEQMSSIMSRLRINPLQVPDLFQSKNSLQAMDPLRVSDQLLAADQALIAVEDYLSGERKAYSNGEFGEVTSLTLPQADVLKFFYADGTWVAIRPSGTEPKLKAYIAVKGEDEAECDSKVARFHAELEKAFGSK